jgi:hypothetical protein
MHRLERPENLPLVWEHRLHLRPFRFHRRL